MLNRRPYLLALTVALFAIFPAGAQNPPARLTFEVASIKLTEVKLAENKSLIRPLPAGNGISVRNAPLRLLIGAMYDVPIQQITGGPDWLDSDGYDIEAKGDRSRQPDDLRAMFQNLLADRFQLKFHKEIKNCPVCALTVIDETHSKLKVNATPADPNAFPFRITKDGVYAAEGISMARFCRWLGPVLQSQQLPIIDKTGLEQSYDFSLAWQSELPPNFDRESIPPAFRDRPSIFDALEQQLGLSLRRQRGPIEYYVIDRAERPSGN